MQHDPGVIHFRVESLDAIFDNRDPEPLEARRLNHDWLKYILSVMDNRPRRVPTHLYLELASASVRRRGHKKLQHVLRKRFTEHEALLERRLKENFRIGRTFLVLALLVLFFFIALSQLTERLPLGHFQQAFSEGFLIIGWVALWRPVETLLYDWWPIVQEQRKVQRLLRGKITVR